MTQGRPAFTRDTIHIKLSSNIQTARQSGTPYLQLANRPGLLRSAPAEEVRRDALRTVGTPSRLLRLAPRPKK